MPNTDGDRGRWRSSLLALGGLLWGLCPAATTQVLADDLATTQGMTLLSPQESETCCGNIDGGNLPDVPVFGGKMLGAPMPGQSDNVSREPGGGAIEPPLQLPDAAGRRILWRQIQ
ncbi:hypothetical protein ACI2KO_30675 [Pseudomonas piscis]|uniref:hypothetical protein n=1 Tax=Pseudomonas piscis TaxID=2614538 RepID=UPI00384DBF08